MPNTAVLLIACSCALFAQSDGDRDGLDDALEQQILQRFVPTFLVSGGDCDVLPSEFQPGSVEPRAINRNGTIYGQVFPTRIAARDSRFLEVHYYHLWSRDCGRAGHPLDIEHITVLLEEDEASKWKALYWYAAAHHDTLCDAGNGAKAAAIHAETRGATVWISRGKHASFLSRSHCERGCGGDRCEQMIVMPSGQLINVGEWNAPLNGAVWTASTAWHFEPKMQPAFTPQVLAQLDSSTGVDYVAASPTAVHATVAAGGKTVDAVATGNRHTGAALTTAQEKTDGALNTAARKTRNSLARSTRAVGRFLGVKQKEQRQN